MMWYYLETDIARGVALLSRTGKVFLIHEAVWYYFCGDWEISKNDVWKMRDEKKFKSDHPHYFFLSKSSYKIFRKATQKEIDDLHCECALSML